MGLCLNICLCTTCIPRAHRGHRSVRSSGTGAGDVCEPPHRFWEWHLSRSQEQPVLSLVKSSLQPRTSHFLKQCAFCLACFEGHCLGDLSQSSFCFYSRPSLTLNSGTKSFTGPCPTPTPSWRMGTPPSKDPT